MAKFCKNEYDTIICGAGPAGLMAAYTLGNLTKGASRILLLDRKEPWKEPIFCAEAVSTDRLSALWPLNPEFIRGKLSGIYFTSPKKYRAEFYSKDCGLILNRSKFHKEIANSALKLGVECHFDIYVQKLNPTEKGWEILVKKGNESYTLYAKTVIDASGPGAKLTRKLATFDSIESGDTDLENAIFAVAEGIEHSKEHIELFFGSEFKNGYGWIFPRDGVEVNIGFVLGKNIKSKEPLRNKLLNFIKNNYPHATVKAIYGGMIACGQSEKPIAKKGLFKSGDAASCTNPISRSGIVESLLSGKIVAEAVYQWLNTNNQERRIKIEKSAYQRWMKKLGKNHLQIAAAKKGFNSISDAQFDKAAKNLSKLPREKQTLVRIFLNVLWSCPSILWKMRSFLH